MKKDWKEYLNESDREVLAGLIEAAEKRKCAFLEADDVKVAQLWCALIEIKQQLDRIEETAHTLASPFKAIVEIGESAKRKAIERVVREVVKPEIGQEEATKKLVDSLMKF